MFGAIAEEKVAEFDPFSEEAAKALERADDDSAEVRSFFEPGQLRKLTELVRPSLVTVRQKGRDGQKRGTGSGFIVSEDGLVVTNLHVTGEGRPIEVELSDGSTHEVVEVHASDRRYDLAVIRIDAGKDLQALSLGDSAAVEQGDLIAGFGAPQGLAFSVVPGVVSAIRELEENFVGDDTPDYPMMQLAMPIEQGNSGGPVIDLNGEVLGVVTLRHRITDNLGFAVLSNDVKVLLDKPNPVPIGRWRTIGVLDPKRWTPLMGGEWSQRGGTISAAQLGAGFGGRSLCLSSADVPDTPYEVAVRVRMDDESGAAGLVFASDGEDAHYGFYPSGGKMRLTRFEGPDVYSWSILEQVDAPSYRDGDWNHLRVRVEDTKITGWVNGEKVVETEDGVLRGGVVGLCKFRQTESDYRNFEVGANLEPRAVSEELDEELRASIERFLGGSEPDGFLDELSRDIRHSRDLIEEKVEQLERAAADLRGLEKDVSRHLVMNELLMTLDRPESEVDLFEVGLQIARMDDPELDVDHYRSVFSSLVADARAYLDENAVEAGPREQAEALSDFLFKETGFHGSRTEYYHHANSYVNRVIDDREGLPITLSVVFIEIARRLEIPNVFGAPLPGKFMVGITYPDGEKENTAFIDVFEGGKVIDRGTAARRIAEMIGATPPEEAFQPAPARDIAVRMLRNLVDIEVNRRQTPDGAQNYIELLLAIEPNSPQERFQRALLRIQDKDVDGAREDLDWLLDERPPGLDYLRLEQFRDSLPVE
ncbi:MAG: transglutaminase family protein [Verrucomicrobiales bacterium]